MRIRPLAVITLSAALGSGTLVTSADAAPAPATMDVSGTGLSGLHLGSSESSAMAFLTGKLGRPSGKLSLTPGFKLCGVGAVASWSSMNAYFNANRLVGLSFGPGHLPSVQTAAGLKLGSTLGQARILYPKKLTTSNNQGGAWFASTPVGKIEGFLNPSTYKAPTPAAKILTIDVGVVGCPAETP